MKIYVMDSLYEITIALILIVMGLIPIEAYRQTEPKKRDSALRFLVVGIGSLISGLSYLLYLAFT